MGSDVGNLVVQDALTQGWHPRQMRRELQRKEKERALLLSAKEQPDANVMPQLLKPPLPAPAAELCSHPPVSNAHQERPPAIATRHTWYNSLDLTKETILRACPEQ